MGKMYGHTVSSYRLATNKEDLEKIAKNENLSKTDLRIFILLACRLNSDDPTRIDKKQLSDTLGISKKELSRSLEKLETEDIIVQTSDSSVRNGYKFSYSKKFSDRDDDDKFEFEQ